MFNFPPEVAPILVYFVTNGVKSVFGDISGVGSAIVATFVGAVIFFGEGVINALGPDAAAIATAAVGFALVVLGAFGVHDSIAKWTGKAA